MRRKVQFRLFLIELHRNEIDVVLVGLKPDETTYQGLMLPTFFLFKPSEPAKSISLSNCPVFPTNALLFAELAPS